MRRALLMEVYEGDTRSARFVVDRDGSVRDLPVRIDGCLEICRALKSGLDLATGPFSAGHAFPLDSPVVLLFGARVVVIFPFPIDEQDLSMAEACRVLCVRRTDLYRFQSKGWLTLAAGKAGAVEVGALLATPPVRVLGDWALPELLPPIGVLARFGDGLADRSASRAPTRCDLFREAATGTLGPEGRAQVAALCAIPLSVTACDGAFRALPEQIERPARGEVATGPTSACDRAFRALPEQIERPARGEVAEEPPQEPEELWLSEEEKDFDAPFLGAIPAALYPPPKGDMDDWMPGSAGTGPVGTRLQACPSPAGWDDRTPPRPESSAGKPKKMVAPPKKTRAVLAPPPAPDSPSVPRAGMTYGFAPATTRRRSEPVPAVPPARAPAAEAKTEALAELLDFDRDAEPEERTKREVTVYKRRTTVRYFERMNPRKTFPLLAVISRHAVKKVVIEDVRQVEGRTYEIREDDPYVTVIPVLPGCRVVPERIVLDSRPEKAAATFWVTPLALGMYADAYVEVHYQGRVVDRVQIPTEVRTQRAAKASALAGFLLPAFSRLMEGTAFATELGERGGDSLARFLAWTLTAPEARWAYAILFVVVAVLAYFRCRPKQATPIERFFELD